MDICHETVIALVLLTIKPALTRLLPTQAAHRLRLAMFFTPNISMTPASPELLLGTLKQRGGHVL